MERALVLLAVPLAACGGITYVDAPTAPARAPAATATATTSAPLPSATASPPPETPSAAVSAVPASIVVTPPSSPPPAPLSAAAVAGITARAASFYAAAAPFACDLNVETTAHQPKAPSSRVQLHLTFERPGKLHVAFSTGAVLIVNAGMLYVTDPSSQQRMQTPVAADYVPLAFAYAGASFAARATFTAYDGAVLNMPGTEVLVGPPSAAASGVQKALFFDDAAGEVKRTLLIADKGVRQRFDVLQCKMHVMPAASLFAPPTGQATVTTSIASSPLLGVP